MIIFLELHITRGISIHGCVESKFISNQSSSCACMLTTHAQKLTRTPGDKVWRLWVERFNIELKDSPEQQSWTIDRDYIIYISIDMQVDELPNFMNWKCAWHPVFDCFQTRHNQFTVGATNYTRSGVGAHRLSFILTIFMKYVPKATLLKMLINDIQSRYLSTHPFESKVED